MIHTLVYFEKDDVAICLESIISVETESKMFTREKEKIATRTERTFVRLEGTEYVIYLPSYTVKQVLHKLATGEEPR